MYGFQRPYTLKFLWAPFIDHLPFPFLTKIFGRRKGWLLGSQLCLIFALLLLGTTNPHTHIFMTVLAGVLVALCSATQDIVFEAYRVEVLDARIRCHFLPNQIAVNSKY